jgi:hypothetical protein
MPEQLERFARPVSAVETPGVSTRWGISRNSIMLVVSMVALFAGGAGAGVTVYKWLNGEQAKAQNEAAQLQPDARANAIIEEFNKNPDSHPRLRDEVKKLDTDLEYRPPSGAMSTYESFAFQVIATRTAGLTLERRKLASEKKQADASAQDHLASGRNHNQDTEKKGQETRVAIKQGDLVEGVLSPEVINSLSRGARGGALGDPNLLGIPQTKGFGSLPIGTTRQVDPLKNNSNFGKSDDPLKNTSNIGK